MNMNQLRDLLGQLSNGEISISKMLEVINEQPDLKLQNYFERLREVLEVSGELDITDLEYCKELVAVKSKYKYVCNADNCQKTIKDDSSKMESADEVGLGVKERKAMFRKVRLRMELSEAKAKTESTAIGFAEWCGNNAEKCNGQEFWEVNNKVVTTSQLFKEYQESLKK